MPAAADYLEWAERHRTVFALTTPGDEDMLESWCDLFCAAGYTPTELNDATTWLATNAAPRYRSEHLQAIQVRIKASRAERLADPSEVPTHPPCRMCGSSGYVEVPTAGLMTTAKTVLGEDTTATMFCKCPLGLWLSRNKGGLANVLALERVKPDWRNELARIKAKRAARVRAEHVTTKLDRALGEILTRLKAKEATTAP